MSHTAWYLSNLGQHPFLAVSTWDPTELVAALKQPNTGRFLLPIFTDRSLRLQRVLRATGVYVLLAKPEPKTSPWPSQAPLTQMTQRSLEGTQVTECGHVIGGSHSFIQRILPLNVQSLGSGAVIEVVKIKESCEEPLGATKYAAESKLRESPCLACQ